MTTTKPEILKILEDLFHIIQHSKVDLMEKMANIAKILGDDRGEITILDIFEEKVLQVINDLIHLYFSDVELEEIANWTSWYVYETDFGKHTNQVYIGPKEIICDSVEKLIYVIVAEVPETQTTQDVKQPLPTKNIKIYQVNNTYLAVDGTPRERMSDEYLERNKVKLVHFEEIETLYNQRAVFTKDGVLIGNQSVFIPFCGIEIDGVVKHKGNAVAVFGVDNHISVLTRGNYPTSEDMWSTDKALHIFTPDYEAISNIHQYKFR